MEGLKKRRQEEYEESCLSKVRAALPKGRFAHVKRIMIHGGIGDFMNSRLQGGDMDTRFFEVIFDDDFVVYANADRFNKDHPQHLFIKRRRNMECIDSIFCYGGFNSIVERKGYEMQCLFLGIQEDTTYEQAMVIIAEFWAHLSAALTIYMAYMRTCPLETARPPNAEYFNHLFSRVHDCWY